MTPVRVKICGLTRASDVRDAAAAGARLLGFVFASSPRRLEPDQAAALMSEVPPGIQRVGLFLNPQRADVMRVLRIAELDLLQFHGDEDNAFCGSFRLPFVKAIAMGRETPVSGPWQAYPDASALLFDSHAPGRPGGTGRVFDWMKLRPAAREVWLAGGLTPENVGQAIREVRPQVVDVSSGVEQAPGIKDPERMRAFIAAARAADLE